MQFEESDIEMVGFVALGAVFGELSDQAEKNHVPFLQLAKACLHLPRLKGLAGTDQGFLGK